MDYLKVYYSLIEQAKSKNRQKVKNGPYYESHHVIPKCLGGSDKKENRVLLTAKEHYMAHRLLCKIYPNSPGLRKAFWILMNAKGKDQVRHVTSARIYETFRLEYVEMRKREIAEYNPLIRPEVIKKNADTRRGRVKRPDLRQANLKPVTCPYCNKTGPQNNMKRWHFDNCKVFTGVAKAHPKIECPYCGHQNQAAVIKQFHGERCKHKPTS